nr:hypothetical protein [Tanacetum cinerariifolium]
PPPAQYLVHQSLAASRRHVAASYWTAASDVAATSASATVGQRRSTPPATGQRWRITVVIGGQRWRSTTVNATGQRWQSTTVAGGEPPLTAAGPPLTTTGTSYTKCPLGKFASIPYRGRLVLGNILLIHGIKIWLSAKHLAYALSSSSKILLNSVASLNQVTSQCITCILKISRKVFVGNLDDDLSISSPFHNFTEDDSDEWSAGTSLPKGGETVTTVNF